MSGVDHGPPNLNPAQRLSSLNRSRTVITGAIFLDRWLR